MQYNEFLCKRPKDINLHVAISNQEGYLELNIIKDKELLTSNKNTGLSTLDKDIAQQHIANGYLLEIEKIKVMTLATIYEKYIQPSQEVHFLKIDVEGLEKEVIQGNKWEHYQPWIVLVEAISPTNYQETYQNWEHLLISAGYCFIYSDLLNRFYISPKHPELRSAFNYPPNIFDGFLIYNQTKVFLQKNHISNELVTNLEERIDALLMSTSWKITQPLRTFNILFQLIIHRLKNLFSHIEVKKLTK